MISIFTKLKLKKLKFMGRIVLTSDEYGNEYKVQTLYNGSIFGYEILVPMNYKMSVVHEPRYKSWVLKFTCKDNIFKNVILEDTPECIEDPDQAVRALKKIAARSYEVKVYLSESNQYAHQIIYFYNHATPNMGTCARDFRLIGDHKCGRLSLLKEIY